MRILADLVARWRTPQPRPVQESGEQKECVLCGADTREMGRFARYGVCESCGYHHSISAWARINLLADPGSFRETHASTTAVDPLAFPDGGPIGGSCGRRFGGRRCARRRSRVAAGSAGAPPC